MAPPLLPSADILCPVNVQLSIVILQALVQYKAAPEESAELFKYFVPIRLILQFGSNDCAPPAVLEELLERTQFINSEIQPSRLQKVHSYMMKKIIELWGYGKSGMILLW